MNKIIFKYLNINFFMTVLFTAVCGILCSYLYETYFKGQDTAGHTIIISDFELYGFIAMAVGAFSAVTLFPVFFNLIEQIRNNVLYCFPTFFLFLTIAFLYVLYSNHFEITSIIVATCLLVNQAFFNFRFKRFLHDNQ